MIRTTETRAVPFSKSGDPMLCYELEGDAGLTGLDFVVAPRRPFWFTQRGPSGN